MNQPHTQAVRGEISTRADCAIAAAALVAETGDPAEVMQAAQALRFVGR